MNIAKFEIGQAYTRNGLKYKVVKLTDKTVWVEELSSQFNRPTPKVSSFRIKELFDKQFFKNRLGLHVYADTSYTAA